MKGRHRMSLRARPGILAAAVAAIVVTVVAGAFGGYHMLSTPACSGGAELSVAASADIAPVVQETVDKWVSNGEAPPAARCMSVNVSSADPADVAAAIAGSRAATLNGVGRANGRVRVPDVWIADSSIWLDRLRTVYADIVPAQAPSLASSPVVLAVPQPVAGSLGWAGRKVGWADVLARINSDGRLRTGVVEPSRDAAGLSGLLALSGAAGAVGPAGQQASIAVLRSLAAGRSAVRDDLLQRFPRGSDAAALASAMGAAPLSEQAVIAFNASQPPVPLTPVLTEPAALNLDYPYTVLPGVVGDKATTAEALRTLLTGRALQEQLGRYGLRSPAGVAGPGFTGTASDAAVKPPTTRPDGSAIDRVLATWSAVTLPGRLLAVIDVSGSMLTPVPSVGGATREQVTVEAARRGLALFGDDWAVGLWTFSTQLEGEVDYRKLVPIGPLSVQRGDLAAALGEIKPKQNGNTGLYDTVIGAYREAQQGWDAGRVNSVVILTDGKNDDPGGISLDTATAELKKLADPAKPIQLIMIGIGNEVSQSELERITQTVGGGVFIATDPASIGDIFLKAIALRSTGPR